MHLQPVSLPYRAAMPDAHLASPQNVHQVSKVYTKSRHKALIPQMYPTAWWSRAAGILICAHLCALLVTQEAGHVAAALRSQLVQVCGWYTPALTEDLAKINLLPY